MSFNFQKKLKQALENIEHYDYRYFLIHEKEEERNNEIIKIYGDAKWQIVGLLNEKYSLLLKGAFGLHQLDLHNWLNYNEKDEVAYFLNEAGSNALNYSQFKAPYKFHLWLGRKGFVVGIEQKGKGFDAEHVHQNQIKDNEGAAFDFFRRCKAEIFFDNPKDSKIVFMEFQF